MSANVWEHLCRQFVSGNEIDGIAYDMAVQMVGENIPGREQRRDMIELDVVAESFDKKHILIGECKWTGGKMPKGGSTT